MLSQYVPVKPEDRENEYSGYVWEWEMGKQEIRVRDTSRSDGCVHDLERVMIPWVYAVIKMHLTVHF